MAQSDIVQYCVARERYQTRQSQLKEQRAEQADAQRTLGGLLLDSMTRNDIPVVCVPSQHGPTRYIRILRGTNRSQPLKNIDDVLELVKDVSRYVTDVSTEKLPGAISKLVEGRARAKGTPGPARIQVSPKMNANENIVNMSITPTETQQLSTQFEHAYSERSNTRADMRPLRAELKRTETTLLSTTIPDGNIGTVEMRRVNGQPKLMDINQVKTTVTHSTFGIRAVMRLVKEAVGNVTARNESFDDNLRYELKRLLELETQRTDVRYRIKTVRHAAAA